MYVYQKTESCLYTVGFYDPNGKWIPETDHATREEAAERVAFLNGGDYRVGDCGCHGKSNQLGTV